jgi:DNA-binding transcriptional LysR family regulator
MDERDFELLLVLNKTRNITHAADLLYVSQSSLSKRIAAIETELATKILIRSRKGVHFTPEGEEVVKYATLVSARLQEMRQRIDFSKNIISGFVQYPLGLTL